MIGKTYTPSLSNTTIVFATFLSIFGDIFFPLLLPTYNRGECKGREVGSSPPYPSISSSFPPQAIILGLIRRRRRRRRRVEMGAITSKRTSTAQERPVSQKYSDRSRERRRKRFFSLERGDIIMDLCRQECLGLCRLGGRISPCSSVSSVVVVSRGGQNSLWRRRRRRGGGKGPLQRRQHWTEKKFANVHF